MKVDNPSSLKKFLNSVKAAPLKNFSQNFLIDKNIINKIIDAANIAANEPLLEIGPGPGALTHTLIEKSPNLTLIEMDRTFAKELEIAYPKIKVYQQDFLKFDLNQLKEKKTKVIANLPYHIASPIIIKLLEHSHLFSEMILMVQLEMAQRLISSKNSKKFGSFTIFVNFYSFCDLLFTISANSFYPKPSVTSALIRLKMKELSSEMISYKEDFHKFVQRAFQQRRKKITTSLSKDFEKSKIIQSLSELSFSLDSRPENLDLNDFLELFKKLKKL